MPDAVTKDLEALLRRMKDLRKRYMGLHGKIMTAKREASGRKVQSLIQQLREEINNM